MLKDSNSLSERELLLKEERKKRIRKRLIVVAVVEVLILMMMSYAWYYYLSHRNVYSEEREVMPPYYLYLVDPNGTDALNLTVGNLHPGETKQIVVGVSNKAPNGDSDASYKIGKNSSFNYELELAYTKNLPVKYTVYEMQKVPDGSEAANNDCIILYGSQNENGEINKLGTFKRAQVLENLALTAELTETNNQEMYGKDENTNQANHPVNYVQYDVYDKNQDDTLFQLDTTIGENGTVNFDLDYYMIEINWQDGIDFSDYLKETDLVYVIVKAMQLEPEEATTAAAPSE